MLCLNSACDIEKLQKLQNRCLRLCSDIYKPMELCTIRLHEITRVNMVNTRRDAQLLNVMFSLKLSNKFKKESVCVTRTVDRYVFDTDIVHKDVYANSPYFKGTALWNGLDAVTQKKIGRLEFKSCITKKLDIY